MTNPISAPGPTTHQKAIQINLDDQRYGTFAEIGAGQEVARWFFTVGGAASTVAETISAYDMSVSTARYGACKRFVSEERLLAMLAKEYDLLIEGLDAEKGDQRRFFVFADTVRSMGYHTSGEFQAWIGIRTQLEPHGPPHDITIHARLLDPTREGQQKALGILGVNLCFATFYHDPIRDLKSFTESLVDGLDAGRIQIDMLKITGPAFANVDNRLCALQLVESQLADLAMFTADGEVIDTADALYGKDILIERGQFRPVNRIHLDIFRAGRSVFEGDQNKTLEIAEMTMNNLLRDNPHEKEDFLARADLLQAEGKSVMVSNITHFATLGTILRRYTKGAIGILIGAPTLEHIFSEKWYEDVDGGILESFGRLFRRDVKLLVYPFTQIENDQAKTITAENPQISAEIAPLYQYLLGRKAIIPLESDPSIPIEKKFSDIESLVAQRGEDWQSHLTPQAAATIESRKLFLA